MTVTLFSAVVGSGVPVPPLQCAWGTADVGVLDTEGT